MPNHLTALLVVLLAFSIGPVSASVSSASARADEAVIADQLPSYPLNTCVVSSQPLGKDAINYVSNGVLVRTCCERCTKKVDANIATYKQKIETAVLATQGKNYPTDKCVVSDEPLEKAVDVVLGTRLVKVCCKGCISELMKEPSKHIDELNKAYIAQQRENYPIKNCAVSDEPLGSMGDPIDHLYGTTLVRFCCKGCVGAFKKDPQPFVAMVNEARMAQNKKAGVKKEKPAPAKGQKGAEKKGK